MSSGDGVIVWLASSPAIAALLRRNGLSAAPRRIDRIVVFLGATYAKEPSVKYHGFFTNADDIKQWAANTYDNGSGGSDPRHTPASSS